MNLIASLTRLGKLVKRSAPRILTFVGVGCTIKAVVASSKAAVRAKEILESTDHELSVKEKIISVAPCYIETGVYTLLGVGAPLAANAINSKRIAALSALVEVVTQAYTNEHQVLTNVLSDQKYDKEKAKVLQECENKHEDVAPERIESTGFGEMLFRDPFGRVFRSSPVAVGNGINEFNAMLLQQDYASINELYYAWNIKPSRAGEYIGYSMQKTGIIQYDPKRPGETIWVNGDPCFDIEMTLPTEKFSTYY